MQQDNNTNLPVCSTLLRPARTHSIRYIAGNKYPSRSVRSRRKAKAVPASILRILAGMPMLFATVRNTFDGLLLPARNIISCFLPLYHASCCRIAKEIKKAGFCPCLCTSVILKQLQCDRKGRSLLCIN